MRQLAAVHGDAGWHAHAFPLSVDGVEIVASLVLLADRRTGRRSGWLPWTALTIGTAASLAANIATADSGTVSRIIAGWPALALLIAVKLLSGILEHGAAEDGPAASAMPQRDSTREQPRPPAPRPASARTGHHASTGTDGHVPTALSTGSVPAALLRAARAVRDELHRDGRPLTRDALAIGLRQNGHPVRNQRLTPLLAALRADPAHKPASKPQRNTAA